MAAVLRRNCAVFHETEQLGRMREIPIAIGAQTKENSDGLWYFANAADKSCFEPCQSSALGSFDR